MFSANRNRLKRHSWLLVGMFLMAATATVPIVFETNLPPDGNGTMDSVAIWAITGSQQARLYITDKTRGYLEVHDPMTNTYLSRIGGNGSGNGQLLYPNGVGIAYQVSTGGGVKDVVFAVERDNHRVSMFSIPDHTFLGHFGSADLEEPYGIAFYWNGNQLQAWITDQGGSTDHAYIYNIVAQGSGLAGQLSFSFANDATLESIVIDPVQQRALLCDESANNVMVSDLNGNILQTFGSGKFTNDPEGIVIYDTGNGEGYIIVTDQDSDPVEFEVFDRKTYAWKSNFSGPTTGTDGIALTQAVMPNLPSGSFYAVNSDKQAHAYDWAAIAGALSLQIKTSQPPHISPIPDQQVNEGATLQLSISATDPNGDAITLSIANLPSFASFVDQGNGTGTITFSPNFEQAGVYSNIRVTAKDNARPALSETLAFTLTVQNVNRPPIVDTVLNQTVDENSSLVVSVSATDPDGNAIALSTSNTPAFGSFTDNGNGTGSISFTPGFEDAGQYLNIGVVATDDGSPSLTGTTSFSLTVNNTNRAPVLQPVNDLEVDEGGTLAVTVNATDPDGDGITLQAQDMPGFASLSDHGNGSATLNLMPDYNDAGLYANVRVVALDLGMPSLSDTAAFAITINNVNRPPEPAQIPGQSMNEAAILEIAVSASDPDGDGLTLTTGNLPAFGSFVDHGNGTGSITFSPGFADAGQYSNSQVIVTDNGVPSLTGAITFSLTVSDANRAPLLQPVNDLDVDEGDTLAVTVNATDPDGDGIALQAQDLPGFMSLSDHGNGSATLTLMPNFSDAGVYANVRVIAFDDGSPSLSDTTVFAIAVNNINRPPELVQIPGQRMDEAAILEVMISASDPDGDGITLTTNSLPTFGNLVDHDNGTGVITFTPGFSDSGVYRKIKVIASDAGTPMLSATRQFSLTVKDKNRPPELAPIVNQKMKEGEVRNLAVSATDPDGHALTLSLKNAPGFVSLADHGDGTGTLTLAPGFSEAGVYYQIKVIATDNGTPALRDTSYFKLTVSGVNRAPVLNPISDQVMNEGETFHLAVSATDPEGDSLALRAENLPAFGGFVDHHDGTGTISFTTDFTHEGLYPNLRVIVVDFGAPSLSDTVAFALTVAHVAHLPNVPENLTATANNNHSITLSWNDNSNNEGGFKIERKLEGGTFAQVALTGPNVESYVDGRLSAATSYVYRLHAFNEDGDTGFGNEASAMTSPIEITGAEVNLALHRPASASSTHPSYPASNAVDGLGNNIWRSAAADSDPIWLDVALQSIQQVGRVVIKWRGNYFARKVAIQASNDSSSWTTLASQDLVSGDPVDLVFTPAGAHFVRFFLNQHQDLGYRVAEVEVYSGPLLPPVAPSELTGLVADSASLEVQWQDHADNEEGFKLERRGLNESYGEIVATGPDQASYRDDGLSENTTYFYRVRAFNKNGVSDYSNEVAFKTPADPTVNLALRHPISSSGSHPDFPAGNAVDSSRATYWQSKKASIDTAEWLNLDLEAIQLVGRARLNWRGGYYGKTLELQASADSLQWSTVYSSSSGFGGEQNFAFPQISARFVRLQIRHNQSSLYRITEFSLFSGPLGPSPAAPALLTAAALNNRTIRLTWQDSTANERGFVVERCQEGGVFSGLVQLEPNATAYEDSGLSANTTYIYRVRAFNDNGESAFSNEAAATTPSDPNQNLALNRPAQASSFHTGFPPFHAFDGDTATMWRTATSGTRWLSVDLGSIQVIGRVAVKWRGEYHARTFQIQVSFDQSSWTTILTAAGKSGHQELVFQQTPARYIRLFLIEGQNASYKVGEFEVYSGSASNAKALVESENVEPLPTALELQQNYPNPFNPTTTISYSIPAETVAVLKIYNLTGQEVATLVDGLQSPGRHEIIFNAAHLPSGHYFSVLRAGWEMHTRRLLLVK